MRWREWGIMGGFILAVLVITAILVQRQWGLAGEEHRFEALREQVRTGKEEMRVIQESFENRETERIEKQKGEMCGREILPEYQTIYQENSDFAGWIFVEGTRIDYPVMERKEEREYYLHRDFVGENSYAGVPFVGHGNLGAKRGRVCIEWENRESSLYRVITGSSKDEFDSILKLKERGLYETGVELTEGKRAVLFVTCSYEKKEQRFVVAGMEIYEGRRYQTSALP